jgi:membrane associated rhomboid family serine protease
MVEQQYFKFSNSVVVAPLLSVLLIWTVYWVELKLQTNFNEFGIYPRTFRGLRGIVLSPLIHGSLQHVYNNTIPLLILTASLFYFYREVAIRVLLVGILCSGMITWLIGRPSFHIGASGVIYLLASFIFFKGILTKYYRLVALSLMVVFVYGSLLWYLFPIEDGISWEGHLGGFISGLVLAFLVKSKIPKTKKYAWEEEDYNQEEDEFLKHFDENGNFIETKEEIPIEDTSIKIKYKFKKNDSSES